MHFLTHFYLLKKEEIYKLIHPHESTAGLQHGRGPWGATGAGQGHGVMGSLGEWQEAMGEHGVAGVRGGRWDAVARAHAANLSRVPRPSSHPGCGLSVCPLSPLLGPTVPCPPPGARHSGAHSGQMPGHSHGTRRCTWGGTRRSRPTGQQGGLAAAPSPLPCKCFGAPQKLEVKRGRLPASEGPG